MRKTIFENGILFVMAILFCCLSLVSCGTAHHADGWYFLKNPTDKVSGKPLFTYADYERVEIDGENPNPGSSTMSIKLKSDAAKRLADVTGQNIGRYIAYVHND